MLRVFKDGIFWLFCFDFQEMVAVVRLIPFHCAQNSAKVPFFPNLTLPPPPPALDDNTPTGPLCILPWCRRWSCQQLLLCDPRGGGAAFDLSSLCHRWPCLLLLTSYLYQQSVMRPLILPLSQVRASYMTGSSSWIAGTPPSLGLLRAVYPRFLG